MTETNPRTGRMTLEEVQEVLNRVTYPRTAFYLNGVEIYSGYKTCRITIIQAVKDSSPPHDLTAVAGVVEFHRMPDCVLDVLTMIRRKIHQMQCHEVDEWLEYQGAKPFYPHASD